MCMAWCLAICTTSKPGVTWPPPDYLDDAMQAFEREILVTYPVYLHLF